MCSKFPFEEICESEDRSWSTQLVEEIATGNLEELEEIVETLSALDDPRVVPILSSHLINLDKSDAVRQAASDALSGCTTWESAADRSAWWSSGYPILMRHAIRMAEREEKELVLLVARDPEHPFYVDAIKKLEFWEEPHFQELIISALHHKEAKVREVAAKALLWEQPVAAEGSLIKLASDPSDDVAGAALDTLCYCASKEILLALDDLRLNGREPIRDWYESTFQWVLKEFRYEVEKTVTDGDVSQTYFVKWVAPVRHLLVINEVEETEVSETKKSQAEAADASCSVERRPEDLCVDSIIEDLSEATGKWFDKKQKYEYRPDSHWSRIEGADRKRLSDFLRAHRDPFVRGLGCKASAVWQDSDAVLEYMHDPVSYIRKTATYHSRFLPTNDRIAHRLWDMLIYGGITCSFAIEALEGYLMHAHNIDRNKLLYDLVINDRRPSIRRTAVGEMERTDAGQYIGRLLPLLSEPPVNTWDLHLEVLRACRRASIALPSLDHLYPVDNLFLQIELAECLGC
jgi:hypothetical protein